MREAAEGNREVLGARHPDTLNSLGNLADILREKGEFDAATAALADTVAVVTEIRGPEHLQTLKVEGQSARIVLAKTGDADPLKDVVKRMEKVLGKEHHYTKRFAKVVEAL